MYRFQVDLLFYFFFISLDLESYFVLKINFNKFTALFIKT